MVEVLLVTAIWSSTFAIEKMGLDSLGPLTIAGHRNTLGFVMLSPLLLIRKVKIGSVSKNLWLRLMLIGMIRYAFRDSRCSRILAPETPLSNIASNRVLQKVGMQIYQETKDSQSWHLDRDWKRTI